MMPISPARLAKQWQTEYGEDAFRAEYRCSRKEWVEQQVRAGKGRPEAERLSRQMMAAAREKARQDFIAASDRWRDASRWPGKS
jgi:hypothetical protein